MGSPAPQEGIQKEGKQNDGSSGWEVHCSEGGFASLSLSCHRKTEEQLCSIGTTTGWTDVVPSQTRAPGKGRDRHSPGDRVEPESCCWKCSSKSRWHRALKAKQPGSRTAWGGGRLGSPVLHPLKLPACHPSQSQSLPSPPGIMASPEHREPSGSRAPTLFRQQDAQALEPAAAAASRRRKVETNFFMKSRGRGSAV